MAEDRPVLQQQRLQGALCAVELGVTSAAASPVTLVPRIFHTGYFWCAQIIGGDKAGVAFPGLIILATV